MGCNSSKKQNEQRVKSKEKGLKGLCISGTSMPAKLRTHFEVPEHECKAGADDETAALPQAIR